MLSIIAGLKKSLVLVLFLAGGLLFSSQATAQIDFVDENSALDLLEAELNILNASVTANGLTKETDLYLNYYTHLWEDISLGADVATAIYDTYYRTIESDVRGKSNAATPVALPSVNGDDATVGSKKLVQQFINNGYTAQGTPHYNEYVENTINLLKL